MSDPDGSQPGLRPGVTADELWSVLDETPTRISYIDRDRRYRYVNQEYAALVGRPAGEILGRTVAEILGAEEDSRHRPDGDRALSGETVRWEGWVRFPTGTPRYIHRVYRPHRAPDDQVEGFFVLVRDSTEQRLAETEHQRWTEFLTDAIDSIPNGFALYDENERLVLCNSAYGRFFGMAPMDLYGSTLEENHWRAKPLLKTYAQEPAEHYAADWGSLLDRLRRTDRDPLVTQDRDGAWYQISTHPVADGGRVFIRTDITRLKRAEESLIKSERVLRDSEALVRKVLDVCPVPVAMVRFADGALFYQNPAYQLLCAPLKGTAPEGGMTVPFAEDRDRRRFLQQLRAWRAVDNREVRVRGRDGSEFWASVSARLIDYRELEVIVLTVLDLTERKDVEAAMVRQREALYQSEKLNALGGLLAGVAHELNNPLSIVVGQALLLSETATDPDTRQRATRIENAADRCSRIVRTFLAMARHSTPTRREVCLNDVVRSAVELTGYGLRSADVAVELDLADELPMIWGDPDQLNQVLMNLIVNAEQAMAETAGPRHLHIRTEVDARGSVRLVVTDNGPGIPADISGRIFEPFFTTKQVGVGTGVGLSVSHGIVDGHGGVIAAQSEPDKGASFVVTLPRMGEGDDGAAPVQAVFPSPARGRILVVEDEPEISEMLAEILSIDGHEVETARSGNAALRVLAQREFDVILTDMRMPDVDGPGLYTRIENAYPHLVDRIVFITGDALGPTMTSFLGQTGLPYLEKPVEPAEVRAVIQDALTEPSGRAP